MILEILRHWNGHKPGKILPSVGDGAAELLISRGIARRIDTEPDVPERDTVETATRKPYGRPKKLTPA